MLFSCTSIGIDSLILERGMLFGWKSLNFLIARSIKNKGIRATLFFTKPFERGLDLYGDEIVAGYLEDKLNLQWVQ